MNTPIFHQTISMTLKSLNSLDLDFRRKGLESLELREAIEAVTIWEAMVLAGRHDHLREREAAFKTTKILKKSLTGKLDIIRWNQLCLLVDIVVSIRKADDCRF